MVKHGIEQLKSGRGARGPKGEWPQGSLRQVFRRHLASRGGWMIESHRPVGDDLKPETRSPPALREPPSDEHDARGRLDLLSLLSHNSSRLQRPRMKSSSRKRTCSSTMARSSRLTRPLSIRQALAIKNDRLIAVGSDDEVLKHRGPGTTVVDLGGKTVIPGLIDSHTHPTGACMIEFDHPVPTMETVGDVLDYIRSRAAHVGEGDWIVVRQVFITRLKEQRYPTRAELDQAAPKNPVLFSTGPDASLNSMALSLSGIDKDFKPEGPGKVEKDPKTGEPTGILRNLTRYVKVKSTATVRKATDEDQDQRLIELFKDYNAVGITAVIDRNASDSRARRIPAPA